MSFQAPILSWPDPSSEDWPKSTWDVWINEGNGQVLVTNLFQLFRVFGHENETNEKKRAFLQGFMLLPSSSVMPRELRKEVELFFEATLDQIDLDLAEEESSEE